MLKFYSGAAGLSGRFTEGFSLRRLQSHAFVERLIGTIRREYLDQTLFWNQGDLERKLDSYKVYYNRHRCHTGLAGITPAQRGGAPVDPFANLDSYHWRKHCNGLFQTPAAA